MSNQGRASWQSEQQQLHDMLRDCRAMDDRVARILGFFMGRPYTNNPLGGAAGRNEDLLIDFTAFDCVTLLETTIALARSRDARSFIRELGLLRYNGRQHSWQTRLHYVSHWFACNQARAALHMDHFGGDWTEIHKLLDMVPGMEPQSVKLRLLPKAKLAGHSKHLGGCSIMAFASVRARLDFFHVGFVLDPKHKGQLAHLALLHASRRSGAVVREPLTSFLKRNRMRGVAIASVLPENFA